MTPITYQINVPITPEAFIQLLNESTLGERRPVEDIECITGMLENSNLLVTAWCDEKLVGVARSMTDFHYACYLSDLAVAADCQSQGIGKALMSHTETMLGPKCKLILLAAPAAHAYYQKAGFTAHPRCWVRDRGPGQSK